MLLLPDSIATSVSLERRTVRRLAATGEPARIAWRAKGLRVCKAPARLIDVTGEGAGFVASRPAEPGQVLWLGMMALPCEWVKAVIRAAFPDARWWHYHVKFCEPCPAGLLECATAESPIVVAARPPEALDDDDNEEEFCLKYYVL